MTANESLDHKIWAEASHWVVEFRMKYSDTTTLQNVRGLSRALRHG
jgi:hypothetical protein